MEKPNKEYSNTLSPYVSILHANTDLTFKCDNKLFWQHNLSSGSGLIRQNQNMSETRLLYYLTGIVNPCAALDF